MGLRNSRKGLAMALGVLPTFWLSTVPFILTPAMNRLGEYYSAVPYSQVLMLSTVVALMVVPFSLLSGAAVGRRVGSAVAVGAGDAVGALSGGSVGAMGS